MTETVTRQEYFYAEVGSRPGQGYRILSTLQKIGVDLLAFTAFPSGRGQAQLDFFPKDSSKLIRAAEEARIKLVGPKKAFLVQGNDNIGALSEIHRKLADAKVNVYAANGVTDGQGRYGYVIWVKPKHFEDAAKALGV